jgi:hypothetical protein
VIPQAATTPRGAIDAEMTPKSPSRRDSTESKSSMLLELQQPVVQLRTTSPSPHAPKFFGGKQQQMQRRRKQRQRKR